MSIGSRLRALHAKVRGISTRSVAQHSPEELCRFVDGQVITEAEDQQGEGRGIDGLDFCDIHLIEAENVEQQSDCGRAASTGWPKVPHRPGTTISSQLSDAVRLLRCQNKCDSYVLPNHRTLPRLRKHSQQKYVVRSNERAGKCSLLQMCQH